MMASLCLQLQMNNVSYMVGMISCAYFGYLFLAVQNSSIGDLVTHWVTLAGQICGQVSVRRAWNALPNNVEHKVEAIMEPFRSPAGDRTWVL